LASAAWVAASGSAKTNLGLIVTGLLGLWAGYAGVMVLVVRRKGTGDVVADLGLRISGAKDVGVGLAAGIASSLVLVNITYFLLLALGVFDQSDVDALSGPAQELADAVRGPSFVVLALFVGIGAPVVEECFFRGFVQPAAIRRLGAVPGVAFTAMFFALAHFQALQFPGLAVFGLVVGVLAFRTGRLGPSIVAHIAFNGLTLLQLAAR
jgi:membrane protease YdiL (CAAX protease family)